MQISNGFVRVDNGRWYSLDVIHFFEPRKIHEELWKIFITFKDDASISRCISEYYPTLEQCQEALDKCLELSNMYKIRVD